MSNLRFLLEMTTNTLTLKGVKAVTSAALNDYFFSRSLVKILIARIHELNIRLLDFHFIYQLIFNTVLLLFYILVR